MLELVQSAERKARAAVRCRRFVRLHESAPQRWEEQANDADGYAKHYDTVSTDGALTFREALRPLHEPFWPPLARKKVDEPDSAHPERKSQKDKNTRVHDNLVMPNSDSATASRLFRPEFLRSHFL